MTEGAATHQNKFHRMLEWLDRDQEKAVAAYQTIRLRLVKIFYARGCRAAEELADETIDRVTKKINTLAETYEGNPNLYFYGVAKRVFLEYTRQPIDRELPPVLVSGETDTFELERRDRCLSKCLEKLPAAESAFILTYYEGEKSEKIERRQKLLEELEVTSQNLRVRAFRIRTKLQKCVGQCLG
jgi:DNA-directed RNA polymerase specialized sigma24 family protein